jgi:hypothetical protein
MTRREKRLIDEGVEIRLMTPAGSVFHAAENALGEGRRTRDHPGFPGTSAAEWIGFVAHLPPG